MRWHNYIEIKIDSFNKMSFYWWHVYYLIFQNVRNSILFPGITDVILKEYIVTEINEGP